MKTRRNFRNKSAKSRCRKHRYTKRGGGPSLNTYTINTNGAPGVPFVPLAPGAPGPGAWWRPPDWKPIPTPKPKTPKPKKKPGTAFRIPGTTGNTFKFKTPARKDADALIEKKDRIRKLQKFITEFVKSPSVEDDSLINEIVDEFGDLIGDDDMGNNSTNNMVGNSVFGTDKTIRQTVPKIKTYDSNLGRGMVTW